MFFSAAAADLGSSTFWIESDAASLIFAGLFVAAGVFLGYALRSLVGRWQADSIEKRMQLKAVECDRELESRRQEANVAARAEVVKAREEFEKSVANRRQDLTDAEARLAQREAKNDERALQLDVREATLKARAEAVEREKVQAAARADDAERRLQQIAKFTPTEARKFMLTRVNAELRDDAASRSRRIQEAAKEQGEAIARDIIAQAVQRCVMPQMNALATVSVAVPNAEMKGRIVGRDGRNVRTFEGLTGVTVLLDDTPDTVVLSSFDPIRREIARRALESLVADGRIHPTAIEETVARVREDVEKGAAETASNAATEAGVSGLSPDTLAKLGELRFRTSFTQNVLQHSVETALILGTMAAEMGLDPALGRRIGLLHDIGKAITAEKRGAHALLGADFLKTQGEKPEVVAAVAAHHGEGTEDGGVWGVLCAAADALSSARPGARQETLGDYVQRLETIEKIALAHTGVMQALAVQAGRDLRVVVDAAQIDDTTAQELAKDVCREIAQGQHIAGQTRVVVIRETRVVEYTR